MASTTPSRGAASRRALRIDDLVHLPQRGAAVEQFAGAGIARTATQLRIAIDEMRGQPQRLFAQVARRIGFVAQYRHDILGLQHRTNAVSDRLATVRGNHFDRNSEVIADEFE